MSKNRTLDWLDMPNPVGGDPINVDVTNNEEPSIKSRRRNYIPALSYIAHYSMFKCKF